MSLSKLLKRLFSLHGGPTRSSGSDTIPATWESESVDPFDPFPEPVRLEIKDVLDLHTIQPREVPAVVEEYLSEARRLGFLQVRIIHGKGIGVQREIVRGVLARTPFVERYTDAPPEAGGWGATVAYINESEPPAVAVGS